MQTPDIFPSASLDENYVLKATVSFPRFQWELSVVGRLCVEILFRCTVRKFFLILCEPVCLSELVDATDCRRSLR